MKKTIAMVLMATAVIACNQQQKQESDYKIVRDEVMKFHDLVMADHDQVVGNQMKLDTLLKDLKGLKLKFPDIDTLKEKENIKMLLGDLTKAEESMNDWMHKFEPDVTGKSNEDAVQYFKDEKTKIAAVDSLYKKEISISKDYLSKFKQQ